MLGDVAALAAAVLAEGVLTEGAVAEGALVGLVLAETVSVEAGFAALDESAVALAGAGLAGFVPEVVDVLLADVDVCAGKGLAATATGAGAAGAGCVTEVAAAGTFAFASLAVPFVGAALVCVGAMVADSTFAVILGDPAELALDPEGAAAVASAL